jgi:hypothetical protein
MEQQANRAHRPAKEKKKFEGMGPLQQNCKLSAFEPIANNDFPLQVLIRKHSSLPDLESSISRLRDRMMYVYGSYLLVN